MTPTEDCINQEDGGGTVDIRGGLENEGGGEEDVGGLEDQGAWQNEDCHIPDCEVDNVITGQNIDQGWAWMVCVSCFIANFIVDGVMFSFGVILLNLLEYFGATRSKTAWVGSTLVGTCMFMGPVISLLLEYFSCRQVMILGSLISSVGFILSIFAPNIETLIFTFGFLGGAGFGLTFITSILAVGLHFNKRRALATGIATSGSGLGTFAISYLAERLLISYGWQGCILIIAGIVSNLFVCGGLVRPLVKKTSSIFSWCTSYFVNKSHRTATEPVTAEKVPLQSDHSVTHPPSIAEISHREIQTPTSVQISHCQTDPPTSVQVSHCQTDPPTSVQVSHCQTDPPTSVQVSHCQTDPPTSVQVSHFQTDPPTSVQAFQEVKTSVPQIKILSSVDRLIVADRRTRLSRSIEQMTSTDDYKDRRYQSEVHLHSVMPEDHHPKTLQEIFGLPLQRKDIFYSGSLYNLPEYQKDPNMASFLISMASVHSGEDAMSRTQSLTGKELPKTRGFILQAYTDLMSDSRFLMLLVTMVCWTGQGTVVMFIPDLAVSRGVSTTQAALLLSVVGGTNILGRLLAGWLANHKHIDSVLVYACALLLDGLSCALFPFCSSFSLFVVCSSVFGVSMGACVSLRTIVLADVLGISRLTKSFGIVAFIQGIAFIVGPPISGALYDYTKSYFSPYLLTAAMYILGMITCALIRPVEKFTRKAKTSK